MTINQVKDAPDRILEICMDNHELYCLAQSLLQNQSKGGLIEQRVDEKKRHIIHIWQTRSKHSGAVTLRLLRTS